MTISCDVAILGGGTGGYVAAIRAAQLGKSVVVIEMDKLGGTCLHRGCIPSKSLLRSAEVYAEINESESYGIETTGVQLVFPKVQRRKEAVVEQLHEGVQFLMRKNKIQVLKGKGRIIGPSIFSRAAVLWRWNWRMARWRLWSHPILLSLQAHAPECCRDLNRMARLF